MDVDLASAEAVIAEAPTLHDALGRWADGERVALVDLHGEMTFDRLLLLGEEVARRLHHLDPGGTRPIVFLGRQRAEIYVLLVAASLTRRPLAAVNWRLAAPELRAVIDDADPCLVVTEPDFLDLAREADGGRPVLVSTTVDDLVAQLPAAAGELPRVDSDDCLLLVYTSGTTGRQKGVMLSHRNVLLSAHTFGRVSRVDRDSHVLVQAPTFHVSGSVFGLLGPLVGGRSRLVTTSSADELVETVRAHRITQVTVVPTLLRDVLDAEQRAPGGLDSLETIVYGAAPIEPSLLREATAALSCGFVQSFGLTESVGVVAMLGVDDHDPDRPDVLTSVGSVMRWTELKVVDPESCQDVAAGEVGELWARGPRTMLGYWNAPELTAAAITPDGWLRTGDLVRIEGGFVHLSGRLKDMIVSGGENVYAIEVENALMSHPAVVEAAVVGRPDVRWGEVPVGVVVTSSTVDGDELRAHCRTLLAGYKVPTEVVQVPELPHNAMGKVVKTEVAALIGA